MYNTGARVSEIIGVKVGDVVLDDGAACVHLHGKGRKQRSVPLWRSTVKAVRAWLQRNPQFEAASPLLPNRNGRVDDANQCCAQIGIGSQACDGFLPSFGETARISPHTIRHTTAMHLLQAGVDISVIALWLGHESPATTHHYVEADLTMKERALAKLHEPDGQDSALSGT